MPFIRIGILINAFCICVLFVPTIFALLLSFVVLGAAFLFIYLYFLFCCFVCSIFTFYAMPQIFFNSGSFAISRLRNNNAWCFAPVCFCNAFQSFIIVIHVTIKTAGRLFKFDFNFKLGLSFFYFFIIIISFFFHFRSFSRLTHYTSTRSDFVFICYLISRQWSTLSVSHPIYVNIFFLSTFDAKYLQNK